MMLGDYELLRIDNGLIFRNGKTSESTSSINLVPSAVLQDNGIKCTNNAIQTLDISNTLEYQGSENTLEFTLSTDSMRDAWDYSLVHVYLEGTESTGYVISVMSRGFGYETGNPFKTSISNYYQTSSYTCSDRNIKIAVKDKKCYFFVNDNLEYTTPELNITNKIVGICIKDRSDSRFYGVAVKDLVLTSNIKYGLDDGEEIEEPTEEVYIKQVSGNEFLRYDKKLNKALTTRTNNSEETTIEDNCIVLNKSGSETIKFNPAESSDYELSFTGFTDYCVRNSSNRVSWEEFARINFGHGYYVTFILYFASGKSGSISTADGLVTHLYKGSTLVNNTAGLPLTTATYPAETYGTQLIGTDVVYKVVKKGNTVQFCYNDKILNVNVGEDIGSVKSVVFSGQSEYGAFKFSNIEYTDNEFNDRIFEITKPEEIYIREDFTLTATPKAEFEFKNVEYLWDTGETTPSITLNKETEGLYSNSCTVSYNGYSITKTIEYSVLSSEVDFSGILGYQNTVCGGLYKNTQKDELKPQFSTVTSFDYNDPKLYFKAYDSTDTNIAGFKTNFFDLSSDIDNITLEYDINCPISSQRRSYPTEPLMYLRIQANKWLYVWNEETSSYSNNYCEYIGTVDRNGESSNTKIYEVNGLVVTNSEIHAKVQISPTKVILNLSFDGKTITRTYNYAVDKRFLGWSFFSLINSRHYLNPNFTFYVKNFVAYASDYDLTASVKNEILKKSKEDLDAYLESLGEEIETPELSKYEIAKFDGSSFVKRNHDNPKYNLNVDVSKIENGIRLTGESNQKFDFRDTLHLQGSENTLSFNIKYDDIVQGEEYVLYHIFLNNGYLVTFRTTQIAFYSYGTIFYVNFTNETNKKTGLSLNGKNIRATFTNGNVKIYADDELVYDYSSANVTNYISGFMVHTRVGVATNCELTNLSLTSDIDQTDVRNITKIENNKIVRENETVDFETNGITNIENDVISVYTENKTTLTSTSIPLTPSEDWEDIYVDFDVQLNPFAKECSLTKYPMQYLFALQYQQNALFTSKLWYDNSTSSSDKLTRFGFENEKFAGHVQNYNSLTYVNNVLTSKLFTKTSWNHVTVRIKKSQVITHIDFYNDESNEHNYYSYAQNLTISPEYLNLYFALSSTAERPLQNVFENKYRNIKVNYVNPDLKLEIINPDERLYSGNDFYLVANVSKIVGTEKYLWDNNETTSSIVLNKDEGVYSTSCSVKCNGYNAEKTIEYEVLKNEFMFKGNIIAFQNTISPNIFYNSFKEEVNSEIDGLCYFETGVNKLYLLRGNSQTTSILNYTSNTANLRSIKNNITIEYKVLCPISNQKTNYYRSPIGTLRINETQYLFIINCSSSSTPNYLYIGLQTANGSGYSHTELVSTSELYSTNNVSSVKFVLTPKTIDFSITDGKKSYSKTFNYDVDKNFLEWMFFREFWGNSTDQLRPNTEFHISDFIAYETGYEITEDDKAKMTEMMSAQNEEYVAEHGETVILPPEIMFNDVALENEFGKTATITASGTNILSYSWDSGETTSSISKIYEKEKTYTVTATGKGGKTSSKSITIKGIAPELDEHVMWKLCPNNIKYFYYRDGSGVNFGEIDISGTYVLSGTYYAATSRGMTFNINVDESNDFYNGSLCKLNFIGKFNWPYGSYYECITIYLKNNYYIIFQKSFAELFDNNGVKLKDFSVTSGVTTSVLLKGNIIEVEQNNTKKLRYIIDDLNYDNLKFDKIKTSCSYSNGNVGPAYIGEIEIQSLDVAEPNIEVVTSNENAQCFEDVALQIGADQPCGIVCNGEEYAGKFTKKYVENSLFNIKATNKLDNSLYKEIEYTQNIKELVNDINITNELGLVKLYQNQNVDVEYKLPTTLPEDAVIKYYIDGKEVK